MRVVIVCPDYPPRRSGLADHTHRLAHSLSRNEIEVIVVTSPPVQGSGPRPTEDAVRTAEVPGWGIKGARVLLRVIRQQAPDWVIIQYVPHLYGRGGINLVMPLVWLWQRLRGNRLLLILHELYLDFPRLRRPPDEREAGATPPSFFRKAAGHTHKTSDGGFAGRGMIFLKLLVAALGQRLMLRLSLAASCAVAASTEAWMREVDLLLGRRRMPVMHLPSPSAIDRIPVDRQRARTELGFAPEEIVLCFFGTWHVSKMSSPILDSLAMLLSEGKSARLLVIGPESEKLLAQADERLCPHILAPGYLDAETVSRALQASDIFLAPFTDGVSTRRTTVMAALEHGLPVVTTEGRLTDEIFRQSDALRLAPVDDAAAFLAKVRALAEDPSARRALGERGRLFYEAHFSWPVITARLLDVMKAKDTDGKRK